MTRFGVNYGLAETPSIEAKAGNLLHIIPMTSYYSSTAPIRATYASPRNSSSSARLAQVLARIPGKKFPSLFYLLHFMLPFSLWCKDMLWLYYYPHNNNFVVRSHPQKWFCGVSLPTKTILWRQPSPARTSNSQNGWLVVLIQPVSSSFLCVVTPGFKNKTKCISYVSQDQVYTHMIDVINEYIKNSVQNVDKRE